MLTWTDWRDGQIAVYSMGRFHWRFAIVEHDTTNELVIVDPAGYRRAMAKELFDTVSQAKAAAAEFVKEWLDPV